MRSLRAAPRVGHKPGNDPLDDGIRIPPMGQQIVQLPVE